MLDPAYRFMRVHTPESIKPTVRGLYNMANKLATYGTTDMFMAVALEINSKCNIKCSYCPVSKESRGDQFMSEALFKKILTDLGSFPYKGKISPHFYGEPSLDSRLVDLMKLARQLVPGAELIIHTNGIRLTRSLYRDLIDVGVNGFLVTRHTQKWPKNILAIQANEPDASRYMRMHDLESSVLFNRGGTVEPKRERRLRRCFYISDEIAITHDGEVVCCNDFHVTASFGNVKTMHLLRDIWWGEAFMKCRKDLRLGRFNMEVCKLCSGKSQKKPLSDS
jgi:cyclic pyranopterin phosphate synthase